MIRMVSAKILTFFLFTIVNLYIAFGQDEKDERIQLLNTLKKQSTDEFPQILQVKNMSFFYRNNPVSILFKGAMLFYQKYISPINLSNCPHDPSCSNFSKQAIKQYGLVYGIILTSDRLTRCSTNAIKDVPSCRRNEKGKIDDPPQLYKLKNE